MGSGAGRARSGRWGLTEIQARREDRDGGVHEVAVEITVSKGQPVDPDAEARKGRTDAEARKGQTAQEVAQGQLDPTDAEARKGQTAQEVAQGQLDPTDAEARKGQTAQEVALGLPALKEIGVLVVELAQKAQEAPKEMSDRQHTMRDTHVVMTMVITTLGLRIQKRVPTLMINYD